MFSPPKEYDYKTQNIALKEFHDFKEQFILRPPYQRKANIWPEAKRLSFMDSICRGYYIPPLVLRKVRIGGTTVKFEVIDGQQRITTVQLFYRDQLRLPSSLNSMEKGELFSGKKWDDLPIEQKRWISKLCLEADIIQNIEDPKNAEHLRKASDIFWRLQLGERLTFMERQHARVYSGIRNFVTKYADETWFDYDSYTFHPNGNQKRNRFFGQIKMIFDIIR